MRGWERAISAEATDVSYNRNIAPVLVQGCTFLENNVGCYFNANNANFWQFNTCGFISILAGVSHCGIQVERGGHFTFVNCHGGGDAATSKIIDLTGQYQGLVFIGCQAESVLEWLDWEATCPGNYGAQLIWQGCPIDASIYFRSACQAIFIGNYFYATVYAPGDAVKVLSIGDEFAAIHSFLPSGTGVDSKVVFESTRTGVTERGNTSLVGLPAYANNAAAVAGGLAAGRLYRINGDPDTVCFVH